MSFKSIFGLACFALLALTEAQESYQKTALNLHNQYRSKHQVGPLTLSTDLNRRAVQCAQWYADQGKIDHKCPYKNGAGENLYASWGGNPTPDQTATAASNSWYSEEKKHNYNGDYQSGTGHFTQMVWKNSKELGFGIGKDKSNMVVGCALYNPPGNYMGQFKSNVFPPKK